jgi:single-strand DNA-binding protein
MEEYIMASLNKVTLIGNVGGLPEIRTTAKGLKVATLSLATHENWINAEGEKQKETQWHKVVIFHEPSVNFVEKYVGKGDLLFVEGQLQARSWTNAQGQDIKVWEIVLPRFGGEVQLLSKKGQGTESEGETDAAPHVPLYAQ